MRTRTLSVADLRRACVVALLCGLSSWTPALAADLSDLAWLRGSWRVEQSSGTVITETWLAPDGGVMPGVGRTVKAGRARVEFMRIDVTADGALAFTAILPGQPPTIFTATTLTADQVVFENLDHDYPQRVIYARCGADLCAAIEGEVDGAIKRIDWRYHRLAE